MTGFSNHPFDSEAAVEKPCCPRLLRFPGKVERVNPVTQHENAKGKRGDDGHVGNFAKVDIATHLLVSIEGDDDPDHKKHGTHRLVKNDAYGANQIVESGLEKPKHAHAASG
jgi:hypothetical protein